jgi:type IV fimbrial biogenesis protein FimT
MKRIHRGFTLIELMVTISIGATLMLIATPTLITYRRNADLTSTANTLVSSINAARGEALKRGLSAMVVPISNGSNWNAGWLVFVDVDSNRTYNPAIDTLVFTQTALPTTLNMVGNGVASGATPAIIFDSSGYPKTRAGGFGAATLSITRTDTTSTIDPSQTRNIVIALTGRTRVCTPRTAVDSECASTSTF